MIKNIRSLLGLAPSTASLLGLAPSTASLLGPIPTPASIPSSTILNTSLSRRTFLKGAAVTAAAATAAIYIPANRLEYVPRKISTDLPLPSQIISPEEFQYAQDRIEMRMLVDTFYMPYGGILRQNDVVQVRLKDAGRWLDNGIAIPTPGSHASLQPDTTRRALDAQVRLNGGYPADYRSPVPRTGSGSYLGSFSDDTYLREFPQARSEQHQATSPQARHLAVAASMASWKPELEAELERIRQARQDGYDDLWEEDEEDDEYLAASDTREQVVSGEGGAVPSGQLQALRL